MNTIDGNEQYYVSLRRRRKTRGPGSRGGRKWRRFNVPLDEEEDAEIIAILDASYGKISAILRDWIRLAARWEFDQNG